MKTLFTLLGILTILQGHAQTSINGIVTDSKGNGLEGVNVYLDGTYDGSTTIDNGSFSFTTEEKGEQLLIISFLSYETKSLLLDVNQMSNLSVVLKDDVSTLDAVVLSAGTFKAGDNSKVSVLKPLDIVTTANALGDVFGAFQTLPGTTTVAEDGRLFVRGGDANETQIFIDGIRVFAPYNPTPNNTPTRGRYSPFLFDGITFSTGGYSAEYGQALSGVLLLNTINEPDQTETNIQIMSVGGGLGHTQKWEKRSLSVNATYINLAPYLEFYDDRNDWQKPLENYAGETVYREKLKNGLFKFYTAFDGTNFELTREDINVPEGIPFALDNDNLYLNTSYRGMLSDTWSLQTGASYSFARTQLDIDEATVDNQEHAAHLKLRVKKNFSNRFKLYAGAEHFYNDFDEDFAQPDFADSFDFEGNISSAFAEADIIFSKKLALKVGVRGTYDDAVDETEAAPRASFAYKTGKNSQLSLAYGDFYQRPISNVLKYQPTVTNERSSHYILNYQYNFENRLFRAEIFRKTYDDLITFDTREPLPMSEFENGGSGYAQGLDIFWRDNKSIKNLDYWVSYSYLDTERKQFNFPLKATPNFANKHNFSLVTKYWIEDWKSQVGFSYQLASGRSYTNPNEPGFLQETTKPFQSLSLNWAYLISPQKILYASVNNVFAYKNINGYQYADTPNAEGVFDRRTLRPNADQFFFVGFFWTISKDKTKNQLDNL
ncbi:TonB-dependent receptor [Gangjinia marincola]|uniref:TonB-dependent receptor n=1 Tax=Gangjinia marincola TaxID=578463 RepID=A0ABN1MGI2_9FLAO